MWLWRVCVVYPSTYGFRITYFPSLHSQVNPNTILCINYHSSLITLPAAGKGSTMCLLSLLRLNSVKCTCTLTQLF